MNIVFGLIYLFFFVLRHTYKESSTDQFLMLMVVSCFQRLETIHAAWFVERVVFSVYTDRV